MIRSLFATLLAVVLVFVFTSVTFSQEAKEMKKEEKKALKQVTCDPQCGFMVRSHDESEILDVVKTHGKKAHNMEMSDGDVKDRVKTVSDKPMKKEIKKEVIKEEKKMY